MPKKILELCVPREIGGALVSTWKDRMMHLALGLPLLNEAAQLVLNCLAMVRQAQPVGEIAVTPLLDRKLPIDLSERNRGLV